MPPPTKRQRSRSPSPTLPLHLLTSLPGSSTARHSDDLETTLRLPDYLSHGVRAHEASLLAAGEGGEWEQLRQEMEEDPVPLEVEGDASEAGRTRDKRRVKWMGTVGEESKRMEVWTDRYDLLHLLPSLPARFPHAPTFYGATSGSSTAASEATAGFEPAPGFEDLPSDHEELFYFSPAERADLEKRKKRKRMEEEREKRVRQREEEDRRPEGEGKEVKEGEVDWEQGDDPSPTLLALMRRLHTTLSSSPNPSLLELRILANHGSDPRFRSFMRKEGKWYSLWVRIKAGEDVKRDEEKKDKGGGLAGLAAYGSDSEEESEEDGAKAEEPDVNKDAEPTTYGSSAAQPAAVPLFSAAASPTIDDSLPLTISKVEEPTDGAEKEGETEQEGTKRKQREKQEKLQEWARKRREKRGED
ncbi:hypothetical protein JCM11251_004000 [Rhodosporidiobolus azoricus]